MALDTESGLKTCAACARSLPVTAFGTKVSARDGRSSRCIVCQRAYWAEWRVKNPEKSSKIKERWRKKNPAYALEWQRQNEDSHGIANSKYRDKIIALKKPAPESLKECLGCHEVKPRYDFYVNSHALDGRAPKCVACEMSGKRLRFYSLSGEQFSEMWDRQEGTCAICCEPMSPRGKGGCVVDHDHKTGKVRALLCTPCNLAIGHFKDDVQRCESAAAYLRSHTHGT